MRISTTPALELLDVSRIHGRGDAAVHALRGLHLTVLPGELVAVMGPSGSGRSTLLNLAGGLDQATAGRVRVQGEELGSLSKAQLAAVRRRRVGYVFQDYNLIPSLTAAENVALPLELDRVRTRAPYGRRRRPLTRSGWPVSTTGSPTTCPAASSNASPSRGPSWVTVASSSPTSRPVH
jgi:putative ABC transport system ATP-binding protein